jgi:hypothetical protein
MLRRGVGAKTTHLGPPEMTTDVAPEPPRRGRGRPKKATTVGEHTDNVAQEAATLVAETGKRVQHLPMSLRINPHKDGG